jgi:hypothetical protein
MNIIGVAEPTGFALSDNGVNQELRRILEFGYVRFNRSTIGEIMRAKR